MPDSMAKESGRRGCEVPKRADHPASSRSPEAIVTRAMSPSVSAARRSAGVKALRNVSRPTTSVSVWRMRCGPASVSSRSA